MRLNKIQEQFKEHIVSRTHEDDVDQDFRDIFQNDGIPVDERLAIYRNNLCVSLQRVLIARHSVLEAIVGYDFLKALVQAYVKDNLPDHGNLNEYGFDLPSFIDNFEHTQSMPYLGDVARLECAWWRAYYAPDAKPLDLASLQTANADQSKMRFTLHPSVHLIRSDYPVFSIREMTLANGGERSGEEISAQNTPNAAADPSKTDTPYKQSKDQTDEMGSLDIHQGGEFVMTCRPYLKTECIALGEADLKFLVYLRKGHTIGEAYGKVLAKFKDFNLVQTLQRELKRGIFTSFSID